MAFDLIDPNPDILRQIYATVRNMQWRCWSPKHVTPTMCYLPRRINVVVLRQMLWTYIWAYPETGARWGQPLGTGGVPDSLQTGPSPNTFRQECTGYFITPFEWRHIIYQSETTNNNQLGCSFKPHRFK